MHRKTTDLEYHRDGRVVIDADGVDLDMTGYAGKIDEAAAVTALRISEGEAVLLPGAEYVGGVAVQRID